jgi:hypothetical protein
MDFLINQEELAALCGLPHIQQLSYLRGIRPYMDIHTGLVGIKRRVSYQSIAEQMYVEPHQGIKAQCFSRDQVKRSIGGLVRAGLLLMQSEEQFLILKCELASRDYFAQNKAATNPLQKAIINPHLKTLVNTGTSGTDLWKADTDKTTKAALPLNNSYLYFLFEKFWSHYPQKKSKQNAQAVFERLNPDEDLFEAIMKALEAQIIHTDSIQAREMWMPNWKYPANWLAQRCWEDEISTDVIQEMRHAEHTKNPKQYRGNDPFSPPSDDEERSTSNVIQLQQYR